MVLAPPIFKPSMTAFRTDIHSNNTRTLPKLSPFRVSKSSSRMCYTFVQAKRPYNQASKLTTQTHSFVFRSTRFSNFPFCDSVNAWYQWFMCEKQPKITTFEALQDVFFLLPILFLLWFFLLLPFSQNSEGKGILRECMGNISMFQSLVTSVNLSRNHFFHSFPRFCLRFVLGTSIDCCFLFRRMHFKSLLISFVIRRNWLKVPHGIFVSFPAFWESFKCTLDRRSLRSWERGTSSWFNGSQSSSSWIVSFAYISSFSFFIPTLIPG